jgi:REP element-mobilizing transposase RayT
MNNKPKRRKNIRLEDFDYSGSTYVYFITICTHDKQHYFNNAEIAKIIKDEIEFRMINEIKLFCYCIMPNHLHMLLSLTDGYTKKGAGKSSRKGTLQNWVSAYKRYTSRIANQLFDIKPLWQKNFYDHIVRKEESLLKIAEYIVDNPVRKGMVSEWEGYPYSRIIDHPSD